MNQVILLPCGHERALQHYLDTVHWPVKLERLRSHVTRNEFAELSTIFPDSTAAVWGIAAEKIWKRTSEAATVLFSGHRSGSFLDGGDIFATGIVRYKLQNRELALSLWGSGEWEYLLFLSDIRVVNIAYAEFNESIGRARANTNYSIQGSRVLNAEQSAGVIERFGLGGDRPQSSIDHASSVRILKFLLIESNRISETLGNSWPVFKEKTVEILNELHHSDEDRIRFWVDELLDLGLRSDASKIYREVLNRVTVAPDQLRGAETSPAQRVDVAAAGADVDAVRHLTFAFQNSLISDEPDATAKTILPPEQQTEPRYLNAGFFSATNGQPVPIDQPLVLENAYRLGVNIGKFWGPGKAGEPFPDRLLDPLFAQQEVVPLDVAVRLPQGDLQQTVLNLTRTDDSELVFFDLTFTTTGRQIIDVDLLYYGHLLQSRRLEVEIIERSQEPRQISAWPMQDGYLTFTRTTLLDFSLLALLKENPRRLTIVVERDRDYQRIGFRFYASGEKDHGPKQSNLTDTNLVPLLKAVRDQLVKTMNAYHGTVNGTMKLLEKHLGQWAGIGRHLCMSLFPSDKDGASDLPARINLMPGSIIQVAPLSVQVGVPWELLYDRPIESYREGRIKVCPTFSTHKPDECPEQNNARVVCPYGFWGYRYIVEQLPGRLEQHVMPPLMALPIEIPNGRPLHFRTIVYTGFKQLQSHISDLQKLATTDRLDLTELKSLDDVSKELAQGGSTADLLYFYSHGGSNALGAPYIRIGAGAGEDITLIDLDAWQVNLERHRPLIILNACESADYSPQSYENLVDFFCGKGAAGVIGTQCEVKELLANTFMVYFFRSFLKQISAGQALYEARRTMLLDHLDPRGLVYSLFASAEVKLATAILS
jgi:hypothetical protein